MRDLDGLRDVWLAFADSLGSGYSPIYERVSRVVAEHEEVLDLVLEAPPRSHLPNVLLAAVHYLLLGGLDHPLAPVYAGRSGADPGPLFVEVCLTHRNEILAQLRTRHTNTNEVGRSAILAVALQTVAIRAGLPLALVDAGCSAGLNLMCDRYRIDYGPAGVTGPDDAVVQISCSVLAGHPPIAPHVPPIAARVGIDLDPVDVTDPDQVRWQLALVFPDTGRLERTRLALGELQHSPPRVIEGDAGDCIDGVIRELPGSAIATVATTWAAAYLAPHRRVEFHDRLAAASTTRPVAWISAEAPGVIDRFAGVSAPHDARGTQASVLGLVYYDGGTVTSELLGFVHPHGSWIDWRANTATPVPS